jgi:putative ABC transport system permease protein
MYIYFTLALRYLNGRKLRTFLTTLAVVFGVLVLFGMNIILPSMLHAMQANEMAIAGQVDVTITSVTGGTFNASVYDKVKAIDGVSASAPSLNRTISLPSGFYKQSAKASQITALTLTGIDPQAARSISTYPLSSGRFLTTSDKNSAVISQSLADTLGVKLGNSFSIPTINGTQQLVIVGVMLPQATSGNEEVLVPLAETQAIIGQTGKINTIELNINSNGQTQRSQIISKIEQTLGPAFTIKSLSTNSEIATTIQLYNQLFNLFGILALFMGAFIIFNTFRTVVAERRRDIGMMRAIGADRKMIIGLVLTEGLFQGIFGTFAGLLLGYLLALGVLKLASPILSQFFNFKVGSLLISPSILIVSILLGVGVTVLAGLIPALNASKLTPLDALHPSTAEIEHKRQTNKSFFVGIGLVILSLLAFFVKQTSLVAPGAIVFLIGLVLVAPGLVRPLANGFGLIITRTYRRTAVAELAKGNLARRPSRAAITASASMLALAIIIALGGTFASLDITLSGVIKKTLGSDYLFMPPSVTLWNNDLGASANFANRLRSINGVGAVSTLRFANTVINGQTATLLGINPVDFPKVSGLSFLANQYSNEADAYQALGNERALIVNGAFMTTVNAKIGSTVNLVTLNGTKPYRIIAEATDFFDAEVATAFISQTNLAEDFESTEDVMIQLDLKPDANTSVTNQAIKTIAADYPQFSMYAGTTYTNTLANEYNAAFSVMYLLLAMLALPSLIAMLNTLAVGIIERVREIGMLRAIGSTQKQIHQLVLTEAIILAGIGTALGILAGLYLGYVLVIGLGVIFPVGYTFPIIGILVAIVVGLGFGALAAIIPARQATRLEIVQALRYE